MGRVTPHHALAPRPQPSRHARTKHVRTTMRRLSIGAVAVVVFLASGAVATYARLQGNIHTVNIDNLVSGDLGGPTAAATTPPPGDPSAGQSVNILLLGSDQRNGANGAIGGTDGIVGARSDTAIVMHVSADRRRVDMVSIPRDSLVTIPACKMSNGRTTRPEQSAMFNSAFALGWDNGGDYASAAACAWRTVEANTGVHLDDYVIVDFAGFQRMVNAIGGVNICIPTAMIATKANLNLKPGQQVLNGEQALGFARARTGEEGLGNGSDINRIGNQQRLLSAMANQVLSQDVLTNPAKILSFLDAATSSLTTDMSISDATGIAYSLRSIRPADVTFMTTPWMPAPTDRNRVVWTAAAKTVWQRMAADEPIVQGAATPAGPGAGGSAASTAPTATTTTAPEPAATRVAGQQSFTAGDVTAVCH